MSDDPRPSDPDATRANHGAGAARAWLWRRADGAGTTTGGAQRALLVGRVCVIALTLALLALLGRVVQLQSQPDERITRLLDAHSSEHTILARRGALLDQRGRLLAGSRIAHRLFADPHLIEDHGTFPEHVAYTLDYDPVEISKKLFAAGDRRYVVLDERLSDERLEAVRELNLQGLATERVPVRDYPHGSLAGQVLGFVGRDGDGLEGLEAMFDQKLRPEPGQVRYLRDARRRVVRLSAGHEPHTDGQTLRLSLDAVIQSHAERALAAVIEEYDARHGQLVVMDPHTGEILALAHHPRFDPNRFRQADAERWRNRAVTDAFEPGSIFKPFVWAKATQRGLAEPDELIDATVAGYWRSPQGRRLRDVRGHGTITWEEVLIRSSNIGMAQVGMRFGIENLHEAVSGFGFGEPTGSTLPGEVGGLLRPAEQWNHYSETSIPMGQEIAVTALQVTRAFGAFANGGLLVTPTLRAVESDARQMHIEHRVLDAGVAARTRRVMARVVEEGTGRPARSDDYTLFGKTGTAQLADLEQGGYKENAYVASFLAGAPVDWPRIVVGCFIHEPDPEIGYYGGLVAGPPVKRVVEATLEYLGVPPEPEARGEVVGYR